MEQALPPLHSSAGLPQSGGLPQQQPQPVMPVQQASHPVPADVQTVAQQAAAAHPNDLSAADDVDVIEKEWVDRAKQIVAATRTDPYLQEQQVSELQSVYLNKRYGKDVAPSADA